jgi:hypothetical protein
MKTYFSICLTSILISCLCCGVLAELPPHNDAVTTTADGANNNHHQQGTPYDIDEYFDKPINGLPDMIIVKNNNVRGIGKDVYPDPINDGAKLDWLIKEATDGEKVTVKVEGRKGVGAIYWASVYGTGGGSSDITSPTILYADVKDICESNLCLRDNILGYGCGEEYEYAAGDTEFYCGSTEKGWGDIRLYSEKAPADGKNWYVVVYRGEEKIDSYELEKPPGYSIWFKDISADDTILHPDHYSAKLVQAETEGGVPAALNGDNIPTIMFAVVHVDLDVDTNNDGDIVNGFNGSDQPIEGYNDSLDCAAWDDYCESIGLGKVITMNFTENGSIANSDRQEYSVRIRPSDLDRGKVILANAGDLYLQAEEGNPVSNIWNLAQDTVPQTVHVSFRGTQLSSRSYGQNLTQEMTYGEWKYRAADSQFLKTDALTDRARIILTPPVSVAPKYNVVKIWAPLDGAAVDGASLGPKQVIRELQDEGWTFEIYTLRPAAQARTDWNNTTGINDLPVEAFKQCTYDNFKNLPNGAGILIVHGHGAFFASYFTGDNDPELAAWQTEDEQPIEGIDLYDLGKNKKNIAGTVYTKECFVHEQWFTNKWSQTNTNNEAIVWFMSCFGGGIDSVANSAGGRARLGYSGLSSGNAHEEMAKALFGQMKEAEKRTIASAMYEANLSDEIGDLNLAGADGQQFWTTLNPGIVKIAQYGYALYPRAGDLTASRTRAWGGIIFDTSMKNATANTCVTGDIDTRSWFTSPAGGEGVRNGILFKAPRLVDATAVADECQNDCPTGSTGRKLTTVNGYGENTTWEW